MTTKMWTLGTVALVLALLAARAFSDGAELETRTFELQHLSSDEAAALLAPYVYSDREGAAGGMSHARGALTVRELPENLTRIEATLARFDVPPDEVQLEFLIIEADGFENTDPELAEIETELKGLLKYDGYRLLGQSIYRGMEGSYFEQAVLRDGAPPFNLAGEIGRVGDNGGQSVIELEVGFKIAGADWNLISATVVARDGQTMVLGTSPHGDGAYILALTPRTVEPATR